jgi:hypothetical protein
MSSSNQPDLTLVVPSNSSQERTWILEPQGRSTFKIIVVCRPPGGVEAASLGATLHR